METEEFNKTLSILTNDFINHWLNIIDRYAKENKLGPNHKLCVLLFSHLGLEKKLADEIWKLGSSYMNAVVAIGKERNL